MWSFVLIRRLLSRSLYKYELEPQWPSPDKVRPQDNANFALLRQGHLLVLVGCSKAGGVMLICVVEVK